MSASLTLATAMGQPVLSTAAAGSASTGLNTVLFEVALNGAVWSITPWKLIGYGGVALFGLRWVVQAIASRRARAPTMPLAFWLMSVAGSLMLLAYFVWGKNDSVGILSNLMPSLIYSYNLFLYFQHRRQRALAA